MLRRLLPDPFLLVLIATVVVASILPATGGFARFVNALAIVTVVLLFFFHGARLARDQVAAGLTHWRLHLVILGATFVMFPAFGLGAEKALPSLLPPTLWLGVLYLCALSSTVQSAIAFVSVARGNVPAAIASASASQLLGIVITPVLMGLLAGAHGGGVNLGGIGKVALEILVPFVAGQLLHPWIGGWVKAHARLTGFTDRSTIIVSVYGAFSAAVVEGIWHQVPLSGLAVLAAVDAALLAIGLSATWGLGRLFGFDRADRITIQFCGTKKSLIQGVPMARVLFPGAELGLVLLPIMLFHQMQLMACAFIAQRYAAKALPNEGERA